MNLMNEIVNYLNEILPDAKCELNYSKDYELVIAVMLSAQTTDKRVNVVTDLLFNKYPTLNDLSQANINDIINIIRPIGTYNKKASNIIEISKKILKEKNGIVPNDREFIESLPGVGRKTANVVLNNIYNENVIAVDTHVARVSYRLGICSKNDNPLVIEQKINKKFKKDDLGRLHHQLVLFGRYYCKAKKPLCEQCKLKNICREYKKRN
ncbi:MAG TPA: endonuclease III [Tenericutes bacterium]|nr:endonuclease III [Mycoplasmatota bacterium]